MRQKNLLREAVVFLKEKTKTLKEKISISFSLFFGRFRLFLSFLNIIYTDMMKRWDGF